MVDQSPRPKPRPKLKLSYNDLMKIERVVNAEAKGEGVEGRNAVRGVIFNRLMSHRFPNTVDEVLSPSQFEPVRKYGSIDKIPVDEDSLNAQIAEMADYIQLGEDASKGSTFFLNKELSKKRGTDFAGENPMVIGNHTFYKGYQGQEPVTDVNFSHDIELDYQGYDEGGMVSKFMDMITAPVSREYRKEKPLSVKAADEAISLATPIDSIAEIKDELAKENPDYLKVGMLGGMEAVGLLGAGAPKAALSMVRKGADMARQTNKVIDVPTNIPAVTARGANKEFKNTVKAYKLFTKGEDGKLYPLFVDADTEVPVGQYMKAVFPEYRFKAENGNFYVPSRGTAGKQGTGDNIKIPDQETRDMLIEAGFLPKGSTSKTIRAVAARPGWHAGDTPVAKHIGPEVVIDGKTYKIRGDDQVWAEVEMPADTDWQAIADSRASIVKSGKNKGKLNVKTAHITDELPEGGYYRYKTNPNMEGQWLISGDMKVNRILDRDEVKRINAEAGFEDLPTEAELREQLGKGFAAGGLAGEDMYQGVDDYQMAEMGAGMKEGGSVRNQTEAVFKSARGYAEGGEVGEAPDTTIGVDPVSGNEIPMGARPEEVRDDIPAQLSEGEYVVPADVVRFYGVRFFEELRTGAKQGYADMDQNGRIGGEPVGPEGMEMIEPEDDLPFDISELQMVDDDEEMPVGAAEGGYFERAINREKPMNNFEKLLQFLFKDKDEYGETPIDRYKAQMGEDDDMGFFESMMGNPIERGERKWGKQGYVGGGDVTPVPMNTFNPIGSASAYEIKEYVNDAGEVMYIQFSNGQPMTFIPQGFKPKGTAAEQAATGEGVAAETAPTTAPSDNNNYDLSTEMGKVDAAFTDGASAKDWTKATADEFASARKGLGIMGTAGKAAGLLMGGPLGLAAGIGTQSQARVKAYDMIDGIAYQLETLSQDPVANEAKIKALNDQKKELQKIVSTGDDGKDKTFIGSTGIYGGQTSMYERLSDTGGGGYDESGKPIGDGKVSFADTWLGDLLGADGKIGVQGAGLSESRAGARRSGTGAEYEGDKTRAEARIAERKDTPYQAAIKAAEAAPAGSKEQKAAYGQASAEAVKSWQAATNAVAAAQKSGDAAAMHEAIRAQSDASRAATQAKQKETGKTGFWG